MRKIVTIDEYNSEVLQLALKKLEEFDSLKINGLNAYQLIEIEKDQPHLFEKIAEKIKDGRWNPSVGMWSYSFKGVSLENLIRNIVYSTAYFKEKFDKTYKVFYGKKIYNNYLPLIAYRSGFDSVVLDEESEMYWLDDANHQRVLVMGGLSCYDISCIDDEFIESNEFTTYEELSAEMFTADVDLNSRRLDSVVTPMSDAEKKLILAEKIATQNNENVCGKIKDAWLSIFKGENEVAEKIADDIINGREYNADFIKIDFDGVNILAYKFAEDNSGDRVIRLQELDGREKSLRIMCDEINLGLRTELEPYEITNFRVDAEGFVKERYMQE